MGTLMDALGGPADAGSVSSAASGSSLGGSGSPGSVWACLGPSLEASAKKFGDCSSGGGRARSSSPSLPLLWVVCGGACHAIDSSL
jgi:hypothetical protein